MGLIADILILSAGADKKILSECSVTERNKFIGIGSTLLLTAILASLSGSYAIYSTFQSIPIAIAIGIFWGIVIFSLDRYIVTSIDKSGHWSKQFLTALPRLFMALVLAITISKPIELRLFQDAINKSMREIAGASITSCENEWNSKRDNLAKRKSSLEDERKLKTEEIYNKDGIYNNIGNDLRSVHSVISAGQRQIQQNRIIITRGTSYPVVGYRDDGSPKRVIRRTISARNAINANKNLLNEIQKSQLKASSIENQLANRKVVLRGQVETTEIQYTKQISGVQQQIDDHNAARQGFLSKCASFANNARDLPAQLQALSKLTAENRSIELASLLLTLLFVILETAPVIVKLLSSKGTYEEIVETFDYAKVMEQKLKISNLNDEINTIMKISSDKNRNKLEAELKGNAEVLKAIALAQADIAKVAIEKWKQDEITKLEAGKNDVVNKVIHSNGHNIESSVIQ